MIEVRRMLNDLDAVAKAARANGIGKRGEVRLGLRIPPVGDRLTTLLRQWRIEHPDVSITVHELPDYELSNAILRRTIDVAFFTAYGVYPHLVTAPLVREQIFVALPHDHRLATQDTISWQDLRDETILVQDWEDSSTREFYAFLIGIGLPLRSHPASKQSGLALVAAGFGLTLVLESQAQVTVPGVAYRQILEESANIELVLAWAPEAEDAAIGCFVSFMRDHAPLSSGDR
jgi:DNA-binding transcriptional LysR family regulator